MGHEQTPRSLCRYVRSQGRSGRNRQKSGRRARTSAFRPRAEVAKPGPSTPSHNRTYSGAPEAQNRLYEIPLEPVQISLGILRISGQPQKGARADPTPRRNQSRCCSPSARRGRARARILSPSAPGTRNAASLHDSPVAGLNRRMLRPAAVMTPLGTFPHARSNHRSMWRSIAMAPPCIRAKPIAPYSYTVVP